MYVPNWAVAAPRLTDAEYQQIVKNAAEYKERMDKWDKELGNESPITKK